MSGLQLSSQELRYMSITAHDLSPRPVAGIRRLREDHGRPDDLSRFLYELLTGETGPLALVRRRAREVGLSLDNPLVVLIFGVDDLDDHYRARGPKGERYLDLLRRRLLQSVDEVLGPGALRPCALAVGEGIVVLRDSPGDGGERGRGDLVGFARRVQETAGRALPGITVTVGMGAPCNGPEEVAVSFRQACHALRLTRRLNGAGSVGDYVQLGVYHSLTERSGPQGAFGLHRVLLRPLLNYDRSHGTDLLQTLEAYLDCRESLRETARRLYVHPNTVKYRLRRVQQIMGRDPLSQPGDRLSLHLALKAGRLLEGPDGEDDA